MTPARIPYEAPRLLRLGMDRTEAGTNPACMEGDLAALCSCPCAPTYYYS